MIIHIYLVGISLIWSKIYEYKTCKNMARRHRVDKAVIIRVIAYTVCTVVAVSIILIFIVKPYDLFRYYSGMFSDGNSSEHVTEVTFSQDSDDLMNKFIMRFYMYGVKRQPEDNEVEDWINTLENGESGSDVARAFLLTPELLSTTVSNDDYVERLYRCLLGREPDEDGFDYWVEVLDSGTSRQNVVESMLGTDEWSEYCNSYGVNP